MIHIIYLALYLDLSRSVYICSSEKSFTYIFHVLYIFTQIYIYLGIFVHRQKNLMPSCYFLSTIPLYVGISLALKNILSCHVIAYHNYLLSKNSLEGEFLSQSMTVNG